MCTAAEDEEPCFPLVLQPPNVWQTQNKMQHGIAFWLTAIYLENSNSGMNKKIWMNNASKQTQSKPNTRKFLSWSYPLTTRGITKHTKENYCNIHTPKTSCTSCKMFAWLNALLILHTWLATCLSSTTSVTSGSPWCVPNNLNFWDICALYVKSRSLCCVCLMRCIVLEHAG